MSILDTSYKTAPNLCCKQRVHSSLFSNNILVFDRHILKLSHPVSITSYRIRIDIKPSGFHVSLTSMIKVKDSKLCLSVLMWSISWWVPVKLHKKGFYSAPIKIPVLMSIAKKLWRTFHALRVWAMVGLSKKCYPWSCGWGITIDDIEVAIIIYFVSIRFFRDVTGYYTHDLSVIEKLIK